ncbi:MAG: hypothetical protein UMR38_02930 [Candidatus Izemoplasma sp.]|nr:hypothetical protein [Candidatus Izemoplasma sp.]
MTINKQDSVVYLVGSGAEKDIGIPLGNDFLAEVFLSYPGNIFINLKHSSHIDFIYTDTHINHLCEQSFLSYKLETVKEVIKDYYGKSFDEINEIDILKQHKQLTTQLIEAETRFLKDVRKLFILPLYILIQAKILDMPDDTDIPENIEAVMMRIGHIFNR